MKGAKILWTHNFPKIPGGGGNWMYNQYAYVQDDVDLYFMDGLRNPIKFLKHFFKLYKLSKEYDIVHAQYGSAVGFVSGFLPTKKVLSLKGSDWYRSPPTSFFHKVRVLLGEWLTRLSISRYDIIIVMSEKMKKEVLTKFPNKNTQVVVDPIDLDKFVSKRGKKPNNDCKQILFAATDLNNPIKRLWLAEEAVELLRLEMPNVELVKMSGIPHEEVRDFMDNMDVLLITSVYEGWPNVVKEMLSLNIPFVGTDVSDLKLIAKESKSCFVCDPNPIEISQALKDSLTAPRENLRKYVEGFDMPISMGKLQKIYSGIVSQDM